MHYLFIYFIVFGLVGWVLDTSYRSLLSKKYAANTFLPFFSIVYAFGGVIILLIFTYTSFTFIAHVLLGGLTATLVELIGGIFCTHVIKKRYWDYSRNAFNYHGHIDALHAFYWLILSAILRALLPYLTLK